MSHLNPCPDICNSPPPRWCLSSIQIPRIASQFHPCPISNQSRSQDVCLTYIQALSHLDPGLKILASAPSMYFLSSIQAKKNTNQLNPGPNQTHSGLRMCALPPSKSRLTSIQFPTVASPLHPHRVSPPLRPGHAIFISPPSRSGLISIQVARLAAQLHPWSISPHPGLKICILPPFTSCLTPSRSLDSHLTFIQVRFHLTGFILVMQVLFHLHPNFNILISPPSMYCLTSIQVRGFMSHLYPCHVTSIQVVIFASQLHPCPISHQSTFQY